MNSRYDMRPNQVDLLRRIADPDAEPVTSAESRLAVSVRALRWRGYVTMPHRNGKWTAQVTEVGRYYLQHGHHPRDAPASGPAAPDAKEAAVGEQSPRQKPPLAPVRPDATAAQRSRTAAREERPAKSNISRSPTQPHPLIIAARIAVMGAKYVDPQDPRADARRQPGMLHLKVSRRTLPRAAALAQALFDQAAQRGHQVRQGTGQVSCGGACVVIDGFEYEITLWEESDPVAHHPTASELREAQRSSWYRIRGRDRVPSGRLQLRFGHDKLLAADRKRWRLDDKLPEALALLEACAKADGQRQVEAEQEQQRRQVAWEQAMRQARAEYVEDLRAATLRGQIADWDDALRVRAYCDALDDHFTQAGEPVPAEAQDWIGWARRYADRIDPTAHPPAMPDEPEKIDPDQLRPYLHGWSPSGPRAWY